MLDHVGALTSNWGLKKRISATHVARHDNMTMILFSVLIEAVFNVWRDYFF